MTRPIEDYALIGDLHTAALVSRTGSIDWLCLPRFDSPACFAALLGTRSNGFWRIAPADLAADPDSDSDAECTSRSYRGDTMVLQTIWETDSGAVRVIDFMPQRGSAADLVRIVEGIRGSVEMGSHLQIRLDYGHIRPLLLTQDQEPVMVAGPDALWLATPVAVHARADGLTSRFTVAAGDSVGFVLTHHPSHQPRPEPEDAAEALRKTVDYWQDWIATCSYRGHWGADVRRALLTLKALTYAPTGGILAAATTSLPEVIGGVRNWDYRFCWLRDAFFTVNALNRLNATRTMEGFVRFVVDAVERDIEGPVAPLFAIAPGADLTERQAVALAGYRGMGPVRVGNEAATQTQNDGYGSIVMSAAQLFYDARLTPGGDGLYNLLRVVARRAERDATSPDAGLWEYRGRARAHTYTAAMSWAAMHRVGLIGKRIGRAGEGDDWLARSEVLRREVLRRSIVPGEGWISGALDMPVADASSLVLPEIGLLPATHDAFLKTLEVVERRLMRNGFLLRYDEADDFGAPDNAFLLCTFWYIEALAAVGRVEEARELFENILARRNHVGLLSEDVDPRTGELWGNFPQTYSQVGLILCAMRLSRSWEAGLWRAS